MREERGLSSSLHGLDFISGLNNSGVFSSCPTTAFCSFHQQPVGRWRGARRARSSDPRGESVHLVGKLSKEEERRITGRMVEEEILGSRESGIYSTSSGEEEQDEELLSPVRGSTPATPIGGELVAKLRRRSSKMGLLWQQRDRVFSRWRERLFFLTADSLISIDTEGRRLGDHACIEVPLLSIERVELEERRGRLTLLIVSREEGRLLLRRGDGLRLWYAALREAVDRAQGRGLGMSVEDLDRRGIFSERRGRRRTARTKEDKEAVRLVRASSRV